MRHTTATIGKFLFALASTLVWIQAGAQDRPANLTPLSAAPPPPALAVPPPPPPIPPLPPAPAGTQVLDDLEPQVTIIKRGSDKIEEHRVNGKLYMQKITPAHGVPYYLIDEKGDGNWTPRDTQGIQLSVPMWVIGTF